MNFDKEFLCYLICMAWDRLDDEDKIKANEMMLKMNRKGVDVPKVEYVNSEILGRCSKVDNGVPCQGPMIFKATRKDIEKWHQLNDPKETDDD